MMEGELDLSGKIDLGRAGGGLKMIRRKSNSWTPRKVKRFIDVLGLTANVSEAARACGMSRDAAYKLRQRDPDFRREWEGALGRALEMLADRVLDYALNGTIVKVRHGGKVVGEEHRFDARFALSLLRAHHDSAMRARAARDEVIDSDAMEREIKGKFRLIEARLKGLPEPGLEDVGE
jgi:hypothetical protein